jgi:cytochrome P450 family 135
MWVSTPTVSLLLAPDSLPPCPSEPPAIQTARWLLRPIAFMESCRRRYGDAFGVRFLGFERPMVMLSDPEAIRALYTAHEHGLPPGRTIALQPVMGPSSILLLEGREHLSRRKLMLPPFHGERMRSYEGTVRRVTEREIDSWPEDRPFALHPRMQSITLEVILRAVFGVTDPARAGRLRKLLSELLSGTSSSALQFRVLLSRRLGRGGDPLERLYRLLSEIDELLFAQIAERRSDPVGGEREDILSLLLSARFEDGSEMSDREIRDQLVTLLLAGHETTATALAWTLDLLLHHPPQLARLTAEVDTRGSVDVGAGTGAGGDAGAGEGGDAYLRAVISESLRLRPVIPLAGRRLASDLNVAGLSLPAGTDVTPAIWLTHTRADLYPEPYAFRPERFLDRAPTTYGWIPFGGGIRRCLGASFAEMEMRIVLDAMLKRCLLRPASSRAEHLTRRNVTFSPRRGTRVRSTPRSVPVPVEEPEHALTPVG